MGWLAAWPIAVCKINKSFLIAKHLHGIDLIPTFA